MFLGYSMRKISLLAAAVAICSTAPALANKGGHGGSNTSSLPACSPGDISVAVLACSGFYSGNLLSNSSVAAQLTGLNAIGFDWDGDFNALVAAGQKYDGGGATVINFTQTLYGDTVLGIHFGGGGANGVGNGTAFYKFDAGTSGINAITLNYPGSSGILLYSTGGATPPPNETSPGVPEPASWMMMISGFGMVGYGMRRRKAVFRLA